MMPDHDFALARGKTITRSCPLRTSALTGFSITM